MHNNTTRRTVLIVSFHFPPTNSIAAVRIGKFAKYLSHFGWDPIVLTVNKLQGFPTTLPVEINEANVIRTGYFGVGSSMFFNLVGNQKDSSNSLIENSTRVKLVYKLAKLVEPIYSLPLLRLLLVEPIGWYRPAIKAGMDIIKKRGKVDIILSSYGPAMSHVIASKLNKKFGIPWVADFRDLWSLYHYYRKIQPFFLLERKLEKKVMKNSNSLITVSSPLAEKLERLHDRKVAIIHNGFDDEDYAKDIPQTTKFTITYTGKVVAGKQDPAPLFYVIAKLKSDGKISSDNFEIRFFGGNNLSGMFPLIQACHINDLVKIYNFVPYEESVRKQKESTALLLLIWTDVKEKGVYTGKIFEYLGARRPILAIGPRGGVVDKLLTELGTGIVLSEPEEIENVLVNWLEEFHRSGIITSFFNPNNKSIYQYTRKKEAEQLAKVLDDTIRCNY